MSEGNQNENLEKLKLWVQIISSAAIPLVIALMGWLIQSTLSEAGLKKDYVQMAITVLKETPNKENEELRQWALSIVDKNAPVPIPTKLRGQLTSIPLITSLSDIGIEKTIECKKARDQETADWLMENFPREFFRCQNRDEVGVTKFVTKGNELPNRSD